MLGGGGALELGRHTVQPQFPHSSSVMHDILMTKPPSELPSTGRCGACVVSKMGRLQASREPNESQNRVRTSAHFTQVEDGDIARDKLGCRFCGLGRGLAICSGRAAVRFLIGITFNYTFQATGGSLPW